MKIDLVPRFVVDQLVHERTRHRQAEAAWPKPLLLANVEMTNRVVARGSKWPHAAGRRCRIPRPDRRCDRAASSSSRTQEMRTFRFGSSLPPHSIALVSNSRNACATASRTSSGRFASRCMTNEWMRSAISSVHGATNSSHSGRAETTSNESAAAGARPRLTTSTIVFGGNGLRIYRYACRRTDFEHRFRRVVGGHHDHAAAAWPVRGPGQDVQPAHARQPDIQQDDIEGAIVRGAPAPRGHRRRSRPDGRPRVSSVASACRSPRSSSTSRMRRRGLNQDRVGHRGLLQTAV